MSSNKLEIKYGDRSKHFGELRIPEEGEGPYPVAVVIHGGFYWPDWTLDSTDSLAEGLTKLGIATWNIEYRGVGYDGGGWPGTFTDIAKAIDYLPELEKEYPLDLDNVIGVGHSAGGHLATWHSARHRLPKDSELSISGEPFPLKGIINLAGVMDLALMEEVHNLRNPEQSPVADLMEGRPDEKKERYAHGSPAELLPIGVPQVNIHGALDVSVPIGISQSYSADAKKAGDEVEMVEIPWSEHYKLVTPGSDAWPIVKEKTLKMLGLDK